MDCLLCANLERALEDRQQELSLASSLSFYRISHKFVAYIHVEVERAKSDLEEHRSVCVFAGNLPAPLPEGSLRRSRIQERLQEKRIETAA